MFFKNNRSTVGLKKADVVAKLRECLCASAVAEGSILDSWGTMAAQVGDLGHNLSWCLLFQAQFINLL